VKIENHLELRDPWKGDIREYACECVEGPESGLPAGNLESLDGKSSLERIKSDARRRSSFPIAKERPLG